MELPSYAELTKLDAEIITKYVSAIPKGGRYVEIGTKGGGSAFVACSANPYIEAHGIDIDDSHLEFRHPNFTFHRISSTEMMRSWNKPVDVLFIDADHDLAGVDWWMWSRHLNPGGYALFHDYAAHSPLVIDDCERILKIPGWELVRRPELPQELSSIFVCRKLPT